jgi:hypothetical protein
LCLRELGVWDVWRVTIELDSKSVVNGIIKNLTNIAEYDTIIKKSKALLCNLQNFMLILFGVKRTLLLTPLHLHYINYNVIHA